MKEKKLIKIRAIIVCVFLVAAAYLSLASAASPIYNVQVNQYYMSGGSDSINQPPISPYYYITVDWSVPYQTTMDYIVCFNVSSSEGYYFMCYNNRVDNNTDQSAQWVNGWLIYTNGLTNGLSGNAGNYSNPMVNSFNVQKFAAGDTVAVNYYLLKGNSGHLGAGYVTYLANPQVVEGSQGAYTLTIQDVNATPTPIPPTPTPTPNPTASPSPTTPLTATPAPTATPVTTAPTPTAKTTQTPTTSPSPTPTASTTATQTPNPTSIVNPPISGILPIGVLAACILAAIGIIYVWKKRK